jgi:coiled-coil domain-containing protein 12
MKVEFFTMSELQKESTERKERLLKLKRSAAESDQLRFRSYEPETEELKAFVAEQPLLGELANKNGNTVEAITQKIEKESKAEQEFDVDKLQKKQNWDLKRRIEDKLALLDKKTDIAIADMISIINLMVGQRLREEKDLSQIATL